MNATMRSLSALAFSGVLVLGLASCSDDADEPGVQETPVQTPTEAPPTAEAGEPTPAPDQGAVDEGSVAAAIAAIPAAEAEAGGTAFEISTEDGGWEVDVAVSDRYVEVRIAADGSVRGTDDEGDLDSDDRAGLAAAQLTLADAITTAAASAPGGRFDDADLGTDRGTHVWEVTFEDGDLDHEVYVDVATGEVLRVSTDD